MLKNHLRVAIRFFFKNSAFTGLNFFGLATSFTAALTLLAYINFQLHFDDFHPDGDKIFRVHLGTGDMAPKTHPALSHALAEQFPDCQVSRLKSATGSIGAANKPFQDEKIYWVDYTFLSTFGYSTVSGTKKDALNRKQTAVITKKLALRLFKDFDDAIGKSIIFTDPYNNERVFEVTGVLDDLPDNSHLTFTALFSYQTLEESMPDYQYGWSWRGVYTYIKTGSTVPAKVETFYNEIVEKYKNVPNISLKADDSMTLIPLKGIHLHTQSKPDAESYGSMDILYFLGGFVLLLFIVSVFNYINLTAVSAAFRYKEIGIKKVIGARGGQIIKQFFIESILLYGAAFVVSVVVLLVLISFLNPILSIQDPLLLLSDPKVIFFVLVTMLAGITVSSLYTFFLLNRAQPVGLLRNNSGKLKTNASGSILMTIQFVVTITLLISTYAIYDQIGFMRSRNLGISVDQVIVVKPPRKADENRTLQEQFSNHIRNLSFVESLSVSSQVPGKKISATWWGVTSNDKRFIADENMEYALIESDEHFLKTFRIELIDGRNFAAGDSTKVLINQSALKPLGFKVADEAIHQTISLGASTFEIIGVINDYHHLSLKESILPVIITNSKNSSASYVLKLNTTDVKQAIFSIQQTWNKTYQDVLFDYYFLDVAFDKQYQEDVKFGKTIGILTSTVLIISYLGLIGTLIFVTYTRAKEISIRRVLGSNDLSIVYLFFKTSAMQILSAGLIAAPVAFYILKTWLERYAYQIDLAPELFVIPILFVFSITLLAVCIIVYRIVHRKQLVRILSSE
jgi:putative ABC transport system permease protein